MSFKKNSRGLLLQNGRIFSSEQDFIGSVLIENGLISQVFKSDSSTDCTKLNKIINDKQLKVMNLTGKWVIPGVIDSQVHFRQPGLEYKEDIFSGSLAALHGGVTTFLEMPNTSPATVTCEALKQKLHIASNNSHVNYGFFIGATDNNLSELIAAHNLAGCCGIKIFLGSSTGKLLVNDLDAIEKIFAHTTLPISIHSEDENRLVERKHIKDNASSVLDHNVWRDHKTAVNSTKQIIKLARKYRRRIHILHLSTAEEMQLLAENKDLVTVEVTPQHLTLYAPDCYEKFGTFAQMNPPIRSIDDQKGLWQGIKNNTVDIIGSDHAPHTKEEKLSGYPHSPSGISGVQTMLHVMLKHVSDNKLSMHRLIELLCENPAGLFRLNKGFIKRGYDGDVAVLDPENSYTIKHEDMHYKTKYSVFHQMKIPISIKYVVLGGSIALKDSKIFYSDFDSSSQRVSCIHLQNPFKI